MEKEVKIKIRGIQGQDPEADDAIEVVSIGQMYEKDGFICLSYDEVVDEEANGLVHVLKNLMRIKKDQVEIVKHGDMETHMVFVTGRTTLSYYSTPYGEIEVSINTSRIDIINKANGFEVKLCYDLEMNQSHISSCGVNVEVEF